jgi:carboxylesterase
MKSEICFMRGKYKRKATEEEIKTTTALIHKANGCNAHIGILLIHGFTSTPANFQKFGESFIEKGFSVSIPLLPGHGTVPEDLLSVAWQDWKHAVCDAYDTLATNCTHIFVIGLSLGGALALHLAKEKTSIRKIYLLVPAVYPIFIFKIFIKLLPFLKWTGLKFWGHVAGDVKDPKSGELGYGRVPINAFKELSLLMQETVKIIPQVKANTLILQSKVDHKLPANKAKEIYKNLGSNSKEIVYLENTFHVIPVDLETQTVYKKILNDIENYMTLTTMPINSAKSMEIGLNDGVYV